MHSVIKSSFYILFITISFLAGTTMLVKSKGDKRIKIFGTLVLFLGAGESFHLIPRIIEIFTNNSDILESYINTGRFIASISIIFVYLFLFWFWKVFYKETYSKRVDVILLFLSFIGVILSVVFKSSDEILLIMLRNLPTLLIVFIIVYYYKKVVSKKSDNPFKLVWLLVLLGTLFAIGFELLSNNFSFFIILMMPKTLVYIWLVLLGYIAYKKEQFVQD